MKKIITIIVTLMLFTSTASAQTMYLKDSAWSYTDPKIVPDYAMAIYGKSETVKVISTKTAPKMAWIPSLKLYLYSEHNQKVCIVEKNGAKAYIPRSCLTTKKPQYTYKVKNCYRKLTIRKGGSIYDTPTSKSDKRVLTEDLTVYTIGQTNYWYEFYHEGKVYFIRKKSTDIISNEESAFSEIILDGVPKSCADRVKYQYSLMPQELRDDIEIKSITISAWKDEKQTLSGFALMLSKEIWLREDNKCSLENAMLHEIGHLYEWKHNVFSELALKERDKLQLSTYHCQHDEYFAEGLELYVKQYAMLKSIAPNLFNYYVEAQGSFFIGG